MFRKQLLDLKKLNIDKKEALAKNQNSILAHAPVYNTKMDTIDHQLMNLRGTGRIFEKKAKENSRFLMEKNDISQNEQIQLAKDKRNEISKIFAQGMMSLEKPRINIGSTDNNPLAWIDQNDMYKVGKNKFQNKQSILHSQRDDQVGFGEANGFHREFNRSQSYAAKENKPQMDLMNNFSYHPYNQQDNRYSPYLNTNTDNIAYERSNIINKNNRLSQNHNPILNPIENRPSDLRGNQINVPQSRERNIVTGERFEERIRPVKNTTIPIDNNNDSASKLIYQTVYDDQKNNKRNKVDEFIDQNYGSIYIGKKGIIAYEEEKKTQFECQKILNPYHLKQILEDKNCNPVRAECLKLSLKNRITGKSTAGRKDRLKKILGDISNY
jgi:hypothetical protein